MTEEQALQTGREAVREALKKAGEDRGVWLAELEQQAEKDPKLMLAFLITGHLILESAQGPKH